MSSLLKSICLKMEAYSTADQLFHMQVSPSVSDTIQPHPFHLLSPTTLDIVKVRLQTTSQYSSALDGATQIFKNEGPAAFYKVEL